MCQLPQPLAKTLQFPLLHLLLHGNVDWADGPAPADYARQADTGRRPGRSVSPGVPPRRERSRSPMRIDSDKPPARGRSVELILCSLSNLNILSDPPVGLAGLYYFLSSPQP